MKIIPTDINAIHFVGIGGIGMSGIAEALHTLGYTVQGSDLNDGSNIDRLRAQDITVHIGHDENHVYDGEGTPVSVVVVSTAVKRDNPEVIAARKLKIPVIRRAEMLAELMRLKRSIAIGGTHGKTTTTSMVGCMLEECGFDPTVINGGIVNAYGTNTRLGEGDWMVVEADESDGSFETLPTTVAVITNIDAEHMDYYADFDEIKTAFKRFVKRIPFYGFGVLCIDHPVVQNMAATLEDRRILTYGFNPQADIRITQFDTTATGSCFDVTALLPGHEPHEEIEIKKIHLPMPGQHNAQNALVAIAIGLELGLNAEEVKLALGKFQGVKRRFTQTGMVDGIRIIDDYGHHPVEIKAVLAAGRTALNNPDDNRIIAVVQPHRYSRLHALFDDFCTCMNEADTVIIAPVYAAGEEPIEGATHEDLVAGLKKHGHRDVHILDHEDDLPTQIQSLAKPEDMVICLGAGSITKWANALPEQLEKLRKTRA